MKSDSQTKIVSEWEENFMFDHDDPDFVASGGPETTTAVPVPITVPIVPVAPKLLLSEQIACSPRNRRIQFKGKC